MPESEVENGVRDLDYRQILGRGPSITLIPGEQPFSCHHPSLPRWQRRVPETGDAPQHTTQGHRLDWKAINDLHRSQSLTTARMEERGRLHQDGKITGHC